MAKTVAGLVLAAGAGTRIGQPKASILINGERFVDRAIRLLRESGCDSVYVVLGAWIEEVKNCQIIVNKNWEQGISTSLKIGLETLIEQNKKNKQKSEAEITHVLITLVDLPGITTEAFKKVKDHPADIVVATYQGVRGHPVKISSQYWQELANSVSGDQGAKAFLKTRTNVAEVALEDQAGITDVDTQADLKRHL